MTTDNQDVPLLRHIQLADWELDEVKLTSQQGRRKRLKKRFGELVVTVQSHLIQSIYSQLNKLTCNLKLCVPPYCLFRGISQVHEKTLVHSARGQTRLLKPLSALDNAKAARPKLCSFPERWTKAILHGCSSVRLPLLTPPSKDVLYYTRQLQT